MQVFKSPLLILACCFALGICLAHPEHRPPGDLIPLITSLLVTVGACVILGLVCLRKDWRAGSAVFVLAGFAIAGTATVYLLELRFPPHHVRNLKNFGADLTVPIRLEGILGSTPQRSPFGLQFDMEARSLDVEGAGNETSRLRPLSGILRLRLEAGQDPAGWADIDALHLQHGDAIRALAQLRRPRIYQNPGSFNFRQWMADIEDVYWVGTIKNPLLVEKLPRPKGTSLAGLVVRARRRVAEAIDKLFPPWSSDMRDGAVLKAVLLGERTSLDSETIENFRKSGLYHLLVIAGLHIGLLALIAAYALLVEQRAPTLRATLMIFVYLTARLLYREHAALNAIGAAALMLLLYRPAWLFETGFQLSFSAALLIAGLAVPVLMRTTEPYRRALWAIEEVARDQIVEPRLAQFRLDVRAVMEKLKSHVTFLKCHAAATSFAVTAPIRIVVWCVNMLLFSAILQIGLMLPMAQTFHRVTVAGMGLNALAIPAMIALLTCALPAVALELVVPALAAWPAKAVDLVMRLIFALTEAPGDSAWLSFRVADPPAWVAWGFAMSAVLAGLALGRRRSVFWASLASLALFAPLVALNPFAPSLPRGVMEITSLDCGGGDAIFVVLPDQTTMLMGACGTPPRGPRDGAFQSRRWDPGEDIVSPYLWSRGVERIDIVALSDAREEHLEGTAAVTRNFRVGEFWHGANPITAPYLDLLAEAQRRGILVREVKAGDRFVNEGGSAVVLWPPDGHNAKVGVGTLRRQRSFSRNETAFDSGGAQSGFFSRRASRDNSLVLRLAAGDASVLLHGDISNEVEQELMNGNPSLESLTLQLASQRSREFNATDFLGRVLPRIALVSPPARTQMAAASAGTLRRLREAGIQAFRTDLDGAVTVEMQGKSVVVRTYREPPTD